MYFKNQQTIVSKKLKSSIIEAVQNDNIYLNAKEDGKFVVISDTDGLKVNLINPYTDTKVTIPNLNVTNLNSYDVNNTLHIHGNKINLDSINQNLSTTSNATFNNIIGTLTTASQPSITSVGTLSELNINGTVNLQNLTANNYLYLDSSKNIILASNSSNLLSINQNLSSTSSLTFTGVTINDKKIEWANVYDFNSFNQNKIIMHTGNTAYGYLSCCNSFDCINLSFNYIRDSSLNPISPYHYIYNSGYRTSQIELQSGGMLFKAGNTNTIPSNVMTLTYNSISLPLLTPSTYLMLNTSNNIISASNSSNISSINQNLATTSDVTFNSITGTLNTASQTNITQLGTLNSLNVNGNANLANLTASNYLYLNSSKNIIIASNSSNLLSINQNLGTTDTVNFNKITIGNNAVGSIPLYINALSSGEKISFYNTDANSKYGIDVNSGALDYIVPGSAYHIFKGGNTGSLTERFRIADAYSQFSNNVLIGTGSQTSKLNISPSATGEKIALYDFGAFYGLSISGGQMNIHSPAAIVMYNGGRNGDGTEICRISSSGLRLTNLTANSYVSLNGTKDLIVASNSSNLASINQNLSTTSNVIYNSLTTNTISSIGNGNALTLLLRQTSTDLDNIFQMKLNYLSTEYNGFRFWVRYGQTDIGTCREDGVMYIQQYKNGVQQVWEDVITIFCDSLKFGNRPIMMENLTASKIVETDGNKNLISASKNTAYNKNFGLNAGECVEGDKISAGMYTPTLSYIQNVASASVDHNFLYQKINNVISVTGSITVTSTAQSGTYTMCEFSIPTGTLIDNVHGIGQGNNMTQSPATARVVSNMYTNRMSLEFFSYTTLACTFYITFMYQI